MSDGPPRRVRAFTFEQPAALAATLRHVAAVAHAFPPVGDATREVLLVGSGTSKNALLATAPRFRATLRRPVTVLGPVEFVATAPDLGPATLAVFVSQTGHSTTTVAALETAQARGLRTIAVTADATSPFGRAAREVLTLPIGPEPIGPKTKGYTATLVALLGLADALGPSGAPTPIATPDPDAFAVDLEERMTGWDTLGDSWSERFHDADHAMFVGAGRHVGTALEASLKAQEMAGLPASAFDLEEALHGRFHDLGPTSVVFFIVGDAAAEATAAAAAAVLAGLDVRCVLVSGAPGDPSGDVVRVPPPAGASGSFDLVTAIAPFQFFAEHVARRRGVDPDAMRYPGLSARLGIKLPGA